MEEQKEKLVKEVENENGNQGLKKDEQKDIESTGTRGRTRVKTGVDKREDNGRENEGEVGRRRERGG